MMDGLGKRFSGIDDNGNPVFINAISSDKWVGEIQLVKTGDSNICNLCRNPIKEALTEDHVPPKCMGNKGKFHYVNYFNFTLNKTIDYYGIFQGGIKYKTICSKCNNEVLKTYDDEISLFVKSYYQNKVNSESIFKITCRPQLIIKGMIGHFLSASLATDPSSYELQMLAYFWNNTKFNDNINIYFLHYNDTNVVSILREVMFAPLISRGTPMTIDCLKCFPFAFFQVIEGNIPEAEEWNKWLYTDSEQVVSIDTSKSIGKWFPELYYPIGASRVLGHNSAHSVIGFREIEEIPTTVQIQV